MLDDQGNDIAGLAFSPDGRTLLAGSGREPYPVRLWDVNQRKVAFTYGGHDGSVMAVAFTPDGSLAASAGGNDNEIHLWDPATGSLVRSLKGVGRAVQAVGFSADGTRVAWGRSFLVE